MGFPGARPLSRNTETAPARAFRKQEGRHAVDVMTTYLIPAEQPQHLGAVLTEPMAG